MYEANLTKHGEGIPEKVFVKFIKFLSFQEFFLYIYTNIIVEILR